MNALASWMAAVACAVLVMGAPAVACADIVPTRSEEPAPAAPAADPDSGYFAAHPGADAVAAGDLWPEEWIMGGFWFAASMAIVFGMGSNTKMWQKFLN